MKNLSRTFKKATTDTIAVALTLSIVPVSDYASDQYYDTIEALEFYYGSVYSLQDASITKGYS